MYFPKTRLSSELVYSSLCLALAEVQDKFEYKIKKKLSQGLRQLEECKSCSQGT